MLLKLRACLLSLLLRAANAKRSRVLTASGHRRHEARLAKQALEREPALAKADPKEGKSSCRPHGADCWLDSQCCEDIKCLAWNAWGDRVCGRTPGRADDSCDSYNYCAEDLTCHNGFCADYRNLIDWGRDEGKCATGSDSGELTVMTYNTFLLAHYLRGSLVSGQSDEDREASEGSLVSGQSKEDREASEGSLVYGQSEEDRKARVARIVAWAKTRPEDVIALQDMYSFKEDVVAGMVAAGFCHYAVALEGDTHGGDGLAIFSKYLIKDVNLWDFYDLGGPVTVNKDHPWLMDFKDRGAMLATVTKDENTYNILNTHTTGTTADLERDLHSFRMIEYLFLREVAEKFPANEAVFFVGDMNEDKFFVGDMNEDKLIFPSGRNDHYGHYYEAMLDELRAEEPTLVGGNVFSYDTKTNPLTALFQDGDSSQRLDYVLYSQKHAPPSTSKCEILHPLWPADCVNELECQLSDHYPVTCSFSFVDKGIPGGDGKEDPAVSLRANAPAAIVATRSGIVNTAALRG